ncbi:hypothetical protein DUNSADRAFT_14326 [Dunaliella salina]|uniref:Ubiquitin-like protease family profile domain-containing protein n=1 Tax=Dunaliella salina TaxID=3046 RepID=A0ABQ7G7M3_DUNSA|nr:hypothetical protein DUNSADRAFT_14326 [Dunaliella salina]|eukprot:KAF5830596.1 hypothetical protein DUNSADRAFT_14326 [Dunaliella salina]
MSSLPSQKCRPKKGSPWLNPFHHILRTISFLSTGKKRKRDVDSRHPCHQASSPAFAFPAHPHGQPSPVLHPPTIGLHDKLQALKATHEIKPGRQQQAATHQNQNHVDLLGQQQQQRSFRATRPGQQPTPPAWAPSLQHARGQYSQQQPAFLASQTRPVVAKQLHADFNDAALAHARAQRSAAPPPHSTSARSLSSFSAARPQPVNRLYMDLVNKNLRAEQEYQQWKAQHSQPPPVMTIDLTEDNDADLQASRKAREEQQDYLAREARIHKSIQERMERLSAGGAEASFSQAESRARELARRTEALNAKMRAHHLNRQQIHLREKPAPAMVQPSIPAPAPKQQQQQQQQQQQRRQQDIKRRAEVEEVSLVSDEDEEPQPEQEEEEEGGEDEEDYDQEADEEEDEEAGWMAPEHNTPQELASWDLIFGQGHGPLDEQLAYHEHSSIPLTRKKLRCLRDGDWLNDEVINVAMALLQERDTAARQRGSTFPKCHFFNSFFLNKLFKDARAYKYANVRRWTLPKRLANYGQASSCLLECDRLVVPVHCGQTHWACAVVDLQQRQLHYFDSLRWGDALSWPRLEPQDVPVQNNGSDCGVFAIKFAECAGTGRAFDFSCHHMPRIRRALAHRVLQLRI